MSLDIDPLLFPVADGQPSGENLEYDPGFADLERAAKGKPEQQMGGTIIPAEEPNWRDVKGKALDLLARSKDLRVAIYLTTASLRLDGLAGFRDGLSLVRGLLETFWDTLYPQLDPDDDNDPTMRINALAPLTDADGVLKALREAVLVESRAVGRFTYRDFQIATGAIATPKGREATDLVTFDAAFSDAPLDAVQATDQTLAKSIEEVRSIESYLMDRVGSEQTTDLSPLFALLRSMRHTVTERLTARGGAVSAAQPSQVEESGTEPPEGAVATMNVPPAFQSGEIQTRDDVERALQKICDYYERFEPSSPLPLLLKRAKRLVKKSFVEIIRDLAPDAVSQVEKLQGADKEGS